MNSTTANELLRVWRPSDLKSVELRKGAWVKRPVPRHWHQELQLCFVHSGDGEMNYRGVNHSTPPGSLFIVQPGEVHSNRVFEAAGCTYHTVYIGADQVSEITYEITGGQKTIPFFRTPIIFDSSTCRLYLDFCRAIETEEPTLTKEITLRDLFGRLIVRYAERPLRARRVGRERRAVQRARDYLTDNYTKNVSLDDLANVTQLSGFHLNRVFRREVGMPPHAFQIQVRVLRAKALLQQGASISGCAIEAGFADQSHLNRHFKRLAVVTPGQYQQQSKNVQDSTPPTPSTL